jgi:hypothetical protein
MSYDSVKFAIAVVRYHVENNERKRETQRKRDSLHNTAGVPTFLLNALNASAERIAPALPAAADNPCAEALNRVGKTSAG